MTDTSSAPSFLAVYCEEPFRLFFPLGVLCSAIGIGHLLVHSIGGTPLYSGYYHGLVQIQGFEMAFATGFLMTAVPRIIETPGTRPWELVLGLLLVIAGIACLFFDMWMPGEICSARL